MKKILLFILILMKVHFLFSQEFVFPMYFEDSQGNRDTIYIGYDAQGSRDVILTEFGELDISDIPFNSTFDVRISNKSDLFEEDYTAPLFHSKRKIIPTPTDYFDSPAQVNIDIHALHWPVSASWDASVFDHFQREGSIFSSRHPHSWWDISWYPVWWGGSDLARVLMADEQTVVFAENFPEDWFAYTSNDSQVFYVDELNRPIATYFVVLGDSTLITLNVAEMNSDLLFKLSPNPTSGKTQIQLAENIVLENAMIELYSPSGKLLYSAKPRSQVHTLDVAHLSQDMYLLRLWDGERWRVQKLMKQ